MATSARRRPASPRPGGAGGGLRLPPITVAKLEQCSLLVERLVAEKTSVFAAKANAYRVEWRDASTRPLSAEEAASIASGIADDLAADDRVRVAEQLQQSDLRAQDEPTRAEVLLAAGVATAPAFLDAVLRLVALVEMPLDAFEDACEAGTLDDAIHDACSDLRRLAVRDARERAVAALAHYASEAGVSAGETWGVIVELVRRALANAITPLSASSSLTGSPPPTDGSGDASSTTPPGETP